MLVSKHQIKVAKLAGTDDARPLLQQVKVYKEDGKIVAVATDSYILGEIIEPDNTPIDEYPLLPGGEKYGDPEEVLVPATVLTELGKKLKAKNTLPILGLGMVEKGKVITTDLDTTTTLSFQEVEGKYPDYRKLMDGFKDKGKVTLTINPKLLIRALSMFSEDSVQVTIHVNSDGKVASLDPMLVTTDYAGVKKTAVIMPLKD